MSDIPPDHVPLILRRGVYASACVAGSVRLVTREHFGTPRPIAALLCTAMVITLRRLANRYNWSPPRSWIAGRLAS